MGSAFHQLCPRYNGTITPSTPTAIRLWKTFSFTIYRHFFPAFSSIFASQNHLHYHFHSVSPVLSFISISESAYHLHISFIDSFIFKLDASVVLMEYCPESCIRKVTDPCINGALNSLLMHGFSLINARLVMA